MSPWGTFSCCLCCKNAGVAKRGDIPRDTHGPGLPTGGAGIAAAGVRELPSCSPRLGCLGNVNFPRNLGMGDRVCYYPICLFLKMFARGIFQGGFLYLVVCRKWVLRLEGSAEVFLRGPLLWWPSAQKRPPGSPPSPAGGSGLQLLPCIGTGCPGVILKKNTLPAGLD